MPTISETDIAPQSASGTFTEDDIHPSSSGVFTDDDIAYAGSPPPKTKSSTPATDKAVSDQSLWDKTLTYFDLQKQAQRPEQRSIGAKALTAAGEKLQAFVPRN